MPQTEFLQTCRICSHEFLVPERLLGKALPCPHCQRPMEVQRTTAAPDDKLVGQVVGNCKLVRRLGAGALGVVYEAEQVSMKRRVAIKLLSSKAAENPQLVQRFQREAKICGQIQHPHVVGVYDCGYERGVHYLVMELVEGPTLSALLDERGALPWQEASQYVRQVAEALHHVKSLNIIHRDIKPANILITAKGQAKLADLGLAKNLEEEAQSDGAGLTMQGVALGSPAYMAPEQVRNAKDASYAADMYSLGATYYHLLTGSPPFRGRSSAETLQKVLREEPPPITQLRPEVPAGIAALAHRMMAKPIPDRPVDAGAFLAELAKVIQSPNQVRSHRRPGRIKGRIAVPASSPTVYILVAVLLVLVLGALLYFLFR